MTVVFLKNGVGYYFLKMFNRYNSTKTIIPNLTAMKKATKISVVLITLLLISFLSIRYYINNAGKRDIASETTAYKVSSLSIVKEFTSDGTASNKKYLDKPVTISGVVTSIHDKEIILDNSVNCTFLTSINGVKKNQKVSVKGRVIGFDDLLGEVKFDQCSLIKDNQ